MSDDGGDTTDSGGCCSRVCAAAKALTDPPTRWLSAADKAVLNALKSVRSITRFVGECKFNILLAITLYSQMATSRWDYDAYECTRMFTVSSCEIDKVHSHSDHTINANYSTPNAGRHQLPYSCMSECLTYKAGLLTAGIDLNNVSDGLQSFGDSFRLLVLGIFMVCQIGVLALVFVRAFQRAPSECRPLSDVGLCFQINQIYQTKWVFVVRCINALVVVAVILASLFLSTDSPSHTFAIVARQYLGWFSTAFCVYNLHAPDERLKGLPFDVFRGVIMGHDEHELTWVSILKAAPTVVHDRWALACAVAYESNAAPGRNTGTQRQTWIL